MSLTLYVVFVWQFFYEVKSCRILKNLWLLTSYKICSSKELASREWVSKIINLNLVDIRFSTRKIIGCSWPAPRLRGFSKSCTNNKNTNSFFPKRMQQHPNFKHTVKFVCWYILMDDWVVPPKFSQKNFVIHKLVGF